jgi:hypothetical protein
LSAAQVGERLGLRSREVHRLFRDVAFDLGPKLRRWAWQDVLEKLEDFRGNGRSK